MKKLLLSLLMCVVAMTASAQIKSFDVKANLRGDFGLGIGITMPTKASSLDFAPSFNYYFGDSKSFTIDGDFHWNFNVAPEFDVYPLAGPAIFHTSAGDGCTKFGVDLGVGARYFINDSMSAFAEAKYQYLFDANGFDDTFATIGVSFAF